MSNIDKRALHDDLTKAFINYQYRLENPMPSSTETRAVMLLQYRNDRMFNTRVDSLVSGVMSILNKHIDNQ